MPIKYPITKDNIKTEQDFIFFLVSLEPKKEIFANLLEPKYHQKGMVNFLMISAAKGYFVVSEYLAKQNPARINDTDCTGTTALMAAARSGYGNVIESLIKLGANIEVKNKLKKSAFDYMYMQEKQHNINFLVMAATKGYSNLATILAKHNPGNINAKDSTGTTALISAAKHGHQEIMMSLINLGADINIKDEANKTATDYFTHRTLKKNVHYLEPNPVQPDGTDDEILGMPSEDSDYEAVEMPVLGVPSDDSH